MCGRYYIPEPDDDTGFQVLFEQVTKAYRDSPTLGAMKHGEIFPTNIVPVITDTAPALMKWGFSRYDGKGSVINARLETAEEKPMFKKAYNLHRCLIPASLYFEWQNEGSKKHKYALGLDDMLTMAGLYRFEESQSIPLFVILTRPAAPDIAFIHDRMPVIVPKAVREKWLTRHIPASELLVNSEEHLKFRQAL